MTDVRASAVDRAMRHVDRGALRDVWPLYLPAIPFGFIVGLSVVESEMPTAVGWLTSPLVFAGAAQLAILTLAGVSSAWAVITAALVINARHIMYSAAMSPVFTRQPRWMRYVGPFWLIDQVFALATLQADREPSDFRRYYLTAALCFYVSWMVTVSIGMVVGPVVPESWRLDFAPAVMFAGLVLIGLDRVPAAVAAVVGGGVGLATAGLPDRLGVIVGAVAGVVAGGLAELRWGDDPPPPDRRAAAPTLEEPS